MAQRIREEDNLSAKQRDDDARAAVRPGCILAVGMREYYLVIEQHGGDRWQTIPLDPDNIERIVITQSYKCREIDLATMRNLHVLPNTGVGPTHHPRGNERE